MSALHPTTLLTLAFLAFQAAFWWLSVDRLPDLGVVPETASMDELELLSFGDRELLFRIMAFRLNNTGDTFGRFTALKDYNMDRVRDWFSKLDHFNAASDHLPAMSAYYFSQTQNVEDVVHLVDYLYEHSYYRPEEKWWWLTQATYMAMHKLHDNELALKIAKHLEGVQGIPYWAQQMPAFVHEQRGEMEDAALIMENMLKQGDLSQSELNYIKYFMEERAQRLDEVIGLIKSQQERLDSKHDAAAQ